MTTTDTAVAKPRKEKREVMAARVKGKDLMLLSRQLAAFLRAGIPILDALTLLSQEGSNQTLRRTLDDVGTRLRHGEPLADSFDHHAKVFPPAYRSMIRSAEVSGSLDTVLDRLTTYIEREVAAKSKIRAAMTYPIVIVVLSIAVTTLLVTFVLPKFETFFASFHRELPLPTRMLLATSHFTRHWWWAILIGLVVLGGLAVAFVKSTSGRRRLDALLLRMPVAGPILSYSLVERFSRVLSAMLRAGVPLTEAMNVAGDATNNSVAREKLQAAREEMLGGAGIAGPLAATGLFPPAAAQMLRVGESTGSLDEQLDVVASFYEKELDYKLDQATALLEPAVLVVMGLIVGFVALALVSAMYGIYRTSPR